ncbi:glycosyltransferase involved in cell wall biosynthesis [Sporomusaceae bacterium BoRhaA]|nr:glycosyltransferase involved in cell wall biosynthesis [Pelorhabdus rhamnosifermentans]
MKIMMIDPWGINNIFFYTNGLCSSIAKYEDLTLVTNCYYKAIADAKYNIMPIFFRISEKMNSNKLRKIIRGIEYIYSYKKIINELKSKHYDVVHIQWLLQYKIDIYFLKEIRKYCKKIVYTAHNVLPHINGEQYMNDLKIIYGLVDTIVLHGESIKKEFIHLFGEFENKIVIQRHGTYLNQNTQYDINEVEQSIIDKVQKYHWICIFFGGVFYSKGVDRLAKIWLEHFKNEDKLLIIAGRKYAEYKELDALEEDINKCSNILYINRYVEDNLLNYLINKSDIILLPYRHASMSGVIFTAAEFKKMALFTDTGAIAEYIIDGENSFVVENQDEVFGKKLKYISSHLSKKVLAAGGNKFHEYIINNYSWNNIAKKLIEDAYNEI